MRQLSKTQDANAASPSAVAGYCADLRRHAAPRSRLAFGLGERTFVPRRAQWFGQIDASKDRGGPHRARQWDAFLAAWGQLALSAAGARSFRLRQRARLCRGGPWSNWRSKPRNDAFERIGAKRRRRSGAAFGRRG